MDEREFRGEVVRLLKQLRAVGLMGVGAGLGTMSGVFFGLGDLGLVIALVVLCAGAILGLCGVGWFLLRNPFLPG